MGDGCYRCKGVLVLSITFNMLLLYALLWVTNNLANPIVVSLGWMGLGLLVTALVFAYVSEEEEEERG
jgi:uncharacterized membrane protein (DUF485 family)